MLVEMDRSMLFALIKGCDPDYHSMDHPLIKPKGYYCGGHSDRWVWNSHFVGSDEDKQSYIDIMDTHGGLTIYVHSCYEQLGIDLKVCEVIELREYLTKYIKKYECLLESDE